MERTPFSIIQKIHRIQTMSTKFGMPQKISVEKISYLTILLFRKYARAWNLYFSVKAVIMFRSQSSRILHRKNSDCLKEDSSVKSQLFKLSMLRGSSMALRLWMTSTNKKDPSASKIMISNFTKNLSKSLMKNLMQQGCMITHAWYLSTLILHMKT